MSEQQNGYEPPEGWVHDSTEDPDQQHADERDHYAAETTDPHDLRPEDEGPSEPDPGETPAELPDPEGEDAEADPGAVEPNEDTP